MYVSLSLSTNVLEKGVAYQRNHLVAMQKILGVSPALMRPPYGSFNNNVRNVAALRNQSRMSFFSCRFYLGLISRSQSQFGTLIVAILLVPLWPSQNRITQTSQKSDLPTYSHSTTRRTAPPRTFSFLIFTTLTCIDYWITPVIRFCHTPFRFSAPQATNLLQFRHVWESSLIRLVARLINQVLETALGPANLLLDDFFRCGPLVIS